jgi:hypothetical protein
VTAAEGESRRRGEFSVTFGSLVAVSWRQSPVSVLAGTGRPLEHQHVFADGDHWMLCSARRFCQSITSAGASPRFRLKVLGVISSRRLPEHIVLPDAVLP